MDPECARSALDLALVGVREQGMRVRLSLDVQGAFRVDLNELPEASPQQVPVPIRLAANAVDSSDLYLKHKTSYRAGYDQAAAEVPGGVEPILFNERGEITESNIANVAYGSAATGLHHR